MSWDRIPKNILIINHKKKKPNNTYETITGFCFVISTKGLNRSHAWKNGGGDMRLMEKES